MSNLAGNYKISAGEVQGGVDIVREQERRARLQLLDEIREPSPQPIFGEPVKVELEDETSRRIKNTLGDFTQVLINDAKNLIGISRPNSLNSYGSAPPPRTQQAAKKPPIVNGMHKPSQMAPPKMGPDKRAPYQKSARQEPPPSSKPYYPASCPPPGQAPYGIDNSRSRDPATWDSNSKDPKRSNNPVTVNININVSNASSGSGSNVATTSNLCNSTGVVSSYGKSSTSMPSIQNGLPSAVPKYGETTSSAPPPKRPILRPCMFNYPDRKTEKPIEHMEVETILREMQQAVPPPLTAIQTPRTEESGFAFFRADSKEDFSYGKIEEKPDIEIVPQPSSQPKSKDNNFRQTAPAPSTSWKKSKAINNLDQNNTKEDVLKSERLAQKHSSPQSQQVIPPQQGQSTQPQPIHAPQQQQFHVPQQQPFNVPQPQFHVPPQQQFYVPPQQQFHVPSSQQFHVPNSQHFNVPQQYHVPQKYPTQQVSGLQPQQKPGVHQEVSKKAAASGSAPAAKEDANKCISSSLQEDLEVSDSDDEVVEIKNTSTDSAKSPPANKTSDSSANLSATSSNMDVPVPAAAASNSSSSESCDSDSDDSSSESNDSDSSASSEHSDADTPSKMWGLSNFFDETRRNHSPAFLPLDTSTNSSTAVKEEPILAPVDERESFTLDDNSMNGILRGPIADPITDFLELDTPVIRNEILSPIPSPVHPAASSAPPVRGPRTPPSPSYPVKEDVTESNENQNASENKKEESSISVELSPFVSPLPPPPLQSSQTSKHFDAQENRSESIDEKCRPQNEKSKNQIRTSKPKLDSGSSKVPSSHVVHSFDQNESEPSASKELLDASKDEVKNDAVTTVSSSVPSEKSDSAHENYTIKTRQKHSTPNINTKKNKSVVSDNSENGQKVSTSSAKNSANKPKHPTRSCRVPSETKQNTKSIPPVNSAKQEPKEEPKRRSKQDVKVKQDVETSSKVKETTKSANVSETNTKNTSKFKKASKNSPKQPVELKKSEIKRKKKKFAIENFLQTASPERSPIYDSKKDSLDVRSPPEFQGLSSKSPSRPVESSEKGKEKLRRSVRCSERASNTSQSESSGQNSGSKKRNSKKLTKSKSTIENLPIHLEPPPQLLSPIPQDSLIPTTTSECAIPFKIMVCIPLDKITRLPLAAQVSNVENKQVSKPRTSVPQNVDEDSKSQSKDMLEKATKSVNKRTQPKDFKDKPRTALPPKSNKNNKIVSSKTEKSSKSSDSLPLPKVKPTSSVNVKSSVKSSSENVLCDNVDKLPKKRKTEEKEKQLSKKPKVSSRTLEEKRAKEHTSTLKNDLAANQTENSAKSKALERCDSASSLSSLCSQQSQRSSKSAKGKIKDSSSNASDGKRVKTFTPLLSSKEIKQEKEDKPKVHIKKEPGIVSSGKNKQKYRDKISIKDTEPKEKCELFWNDSLNSSSQYCHWEEAEDSKGQITSQSLIDRINRDIKLDWDHFSSEMHKELKEATNLTKHNSQTPIMPMDYYWTEGQKQRQLADKEKDPLVQVLKYFEATVLFILTSQQREEYSKDPDSVYQFYMETLKFSAIITQSVRKLQSCPGSSEFKLLILCLKCQSLLYVKLYNLKIKEIKEKLKGVTDFFHHHCPNITVNSFRNSSHPSPHQSRLTNLTTVPSPHSPTPSPASSVTSQTSGYSSSDISVNHARNTHLSQLVNVPQSMLDMICRQHNHLYNLHLGHDLWEQADMYMTRSNLREFFKEVADQSEPLTLHSSIKELVNYIQKGLSLVKKYPR